MSVSLGEIHYDEFGVRWVGMSRAGWIAVGFVELQLAAFVK